ncbi:MAG: phosphodiesterase, partial [Myxococcota bacterium]
LRDLDRLIGAYREESARLGQEDDRIYAVISDHGVEDVAQNLDMREVFRRCCALSAFRGEATKFLSVNLDEPIETYAPYDVITVINGNLLLYVYVRDHAVDDTQQAWRRRQPASELRRFTRADGTEVDLIDAMLAEPGIDHVLSRGEARGVVHVDGDRGSAMIDEVAPNRFRYRVTGGADPLGYVADPAARRLLDGEGHSARAWLEATHASAFPDGVVRIARLFRTEDVGDMVLLAAPLYDFGRDYEAVVGNYRGGHGGLRADQMRVPYILTGPGTARGMEVATARAEDVGRTLLELLRVRTLPTDLSGEIIEEALAL